MNNLFYSLEDGKYYTYPDGDEATGIQIREVIEANERSISKLQQETEKLKKQYCERTDCGGRIGNSKKVEELQKENEQLKQQFDKYKKKITPLKMLQQLEVLEQENKELKEDISFCLHSIKQEMEMSTDSRTRNEMTSCYEILKRCQNE